MASDPKTDPFDRLLRLVVYDGDGTRRYPTHRALARVNAAVTSGNPDFLVLKGIQQAGKAYSILKDAESKGSTHVLLYHWLGECYRTGTEGIDIDIDNAGRYYMYAIAGGYEQSYIGLYYLTHPNATKQERAKARQYLLDIEQNGVVDAHVYYILGQAYFRPPYGDRHISISYLYKSLSLGYYGACEALHRLYTCDYGSGTNPERGFALLLECEGKGMKDPRLLELIIQELRQMNSMTSYIPQAYTSPGTMALEYAEKLIKRKEASGYYYYGYLYRWGAEGIKVDHDMAKVAWLQADKESLADDRTYLALAQLHADVLGNPADRCLAVEYCQKGLELAQPNFQEDFYECMLPRLQ